MQFRFNYTRAIFVPSAKWELWSKWNQIKIVFCGIFLSHFSFSIQKKKKKNNSTTTACLVQCLTLAFFFFFSFYFSGLIEFHFTSYVLVFVFGKKKNIRSTHKWKRERKKNSSTNTRIITALGFLLLFCFCVKMTKKSVEIAYESNNPIIEIR